MNQNGPRLPLWLKRPGVWVGGLLLAGFLLRLASAHVYWNWFDAQFPQTWQLSKIELSPDGNQYIQQADPGSWNSPLYRGWRDKVYFRPPLASYYFAGLFKLVDFNRLAVAAVQSLLATATYLFTYLVVVRLLGRRIGLLTLALLAIHPVLMFEDTSFEDGVLGMFFMSATLLGVLWANEGRPARWFVPGLASGLALLARPNLALLAAGVMAWLIIDIVIDRNKARVRRLLAFAAPIFLLLLPVGLHNLRASGRWVPVSNVTGENLYWGNNPFPDHRQGIQGYWDIREVDVGSPGMILVNHLAARSGASTPDQAFMAGALEFVKSQPTKAFAGLLEKIKRHLANYEIPRNRNFNELRAHNPLWRLPLLPYSVVLALALLGLRGIERRQAFLLILPWLVVFASEVIFFNASRYRALALPFLLPLALTGATKLGASLREPRCYRPLLAGATLVGSFFLVGQRAVSQKERDGDRAVEHFKAAMLESYADAWGGWQRLSEDRFRRNLHEARRLDPDNLDAFSIEQKLLIDEDHLVEAAENIRARRARCRPSEWLCNEVCDQLAELRPR